MREKLLTTGAFSMVILFAMTIWGLLIQSIGIDGANKATIVSGVLSGFLSLLGGMIGASAVYFVAQLQIRKQDEQQIEAIKIENEHSTQREMRKFYLTNKLAKLEDGIIVTKNLMEILLASSHDFEEVFFQGDNGMKDFSDSEIQEIYNRGYYGIVKNYYIFGSLTHYYDKEIQATIDKLDCANGMLFKELKGYYFEGVKYSRDKEEIENLPTKGIDRVFCLLERLSGELQSELTSTIEKITKYDVES